MTINISRWRPSSKILLIYIGLLILLSPLFVSMYRSVYFETVRRDHYEDMLLSILGKNDQFLEIAPFGYRILNVAAAIPFYAVPPFTFRNPQHFHSTDQLRALQAIALLSYCSAVGLMVSCAYIAYRRYRYGITGACIAGLLIFLFCRYSGWYSLDVPVIAYITIILCNLHRRSISIPLLLLSPLFNEKIFIIYSIFFAIRLLFSPHTRKEMGIYLGITLIAPILYIIMTRIIPLGFPDHQSNPLRYLPTVVHNIRTTLSIRGLFHNILPTGMLLLLGIAHAKYTKYTPHISAHYYPLPPDLLVIPLYIGIAMIATAQYNIGRIAVMLAPLYLFAATGYLRRRIPLS